MEGERRALLRNRRGHWEPKKENEVANELWLRPGEDAGRGIFGAGS